MDSKEIFTNLGNLEERLNQENFRVEGIDLWPFMRFQFVIKLNKDILDGDHNQQSYYNRVLAKVRLLPGAILGIIHSYVRFNRRRSPKVKEVDLLFLSDTSARRIQLDGLWYDSFVDPVLDQLRDLGLSYHVMETSQRFLDREPPYRFTEPLSLQMIFFYIRSLFRVRRVTFSDRFNEEYEVSKTLMNEMNLESHTISKRELRFEYAYLHELAGFFEKKMDRLQPQMVFLVPYNGYSGRALTSVANRRGIQTVDIQHGVQGEYHPAYAAFDHIPDQNFTTIARTFFTWTYFETEIINRWAAKRTDTQVLTVGNLFQHLFTSENRISRHFDDHFSAVYHEFQGKQFVLISLIWDFYLPDDVQYLLENAPDDLVFLIRFHPSTTNRERVVVRKILKSLGRKNYEFDHATNLPIHVLLRNVDLNVTTHSSTVIEAAEFGVHSIVTDMIGKLYYERYLNEGWATFCEEKTSLLSVVSERIKTKETRTCLSTFIDIPAMQRLILQTIR